MQISAQIAITKSYEKMPALPGVGLASSGISGCASLNPRRFNGFALFIRGKPFAFQKYIRLGSKKSDRSNRSNKDVFNAINPPLQKRKAPVAVHTAASA